MSKPLEAPNGQPYIIVQKALIKSSWQKEKNSGLSYTAPGYNVNFCIPDLLPEAAALKFAEKPHPIVADILDIVYCFWLLQGKNAEAIRIGDEQIASLRGVLLEPKTLAVQQEAMLIARGLRLTHLASRSVDLAVLNWDSLPWGEPLAPNSQPLLYFAEPGPILKGALSHRSHHDPKNGAFYDPAVWRLSARHNVMAKCLARSLRHDWRLHIESYLPTTNAPRYRAWRDHLSDAGINPYESYRGRASALMTAIENQMDELAKRMIVDEWQINSKNIQLYHPYV